MFQRISVVVQHFNSVLLHNSFVPDDQPKCVISVVDLFCDFFSSFVALCSWFKKNIIRRFVQCHKVITSEELKMYNYYTATIQAGWRTVSLSY